MRRFLVLASFLAGCTGGFGQAGDSPLDLPDSEIPRDRVTCPVDPDCSIGGDCALYSCPDHWVCESFDGTEYEDAERCINPGPGYPGGGDWECYDEEGQTICVGSDYPDDGGGGAWTCERSGDLVICSNDNPDYPPGGGGGTWNCYFDGEFRICERGGGGGGDGGGGGEWNCYVDGEFRVCDRGGGGGDGGGGDCVGPNCGPTRRDCPPSDPTCGQTVCAQRQRGTVHFDRSDELFVLGDRDRTMDCTTVRVEVTGYYTLYDDALAESCSSQMDEISYVTIANSCNASGDPVERNVGDRFVIGDVDNTPSCNSDADCGGGTSCTQRSAGFCCVPTAPALVGTFLMVAGEDNQICLHHFCPEHLAGAGGDSFVNAGCTGSINSVHLQLDGNAFVCPDPSLTLPMGCGM